MPMPIEKLPQKPPEKPAPKPGGLFGGGGLVSRDQLIGYLREKAPTKHPKTGEFIDRDKRLGYAELLKKYGIGESDFGKDTYRQRIEERMKPAWRKMPDGEAKGKFWKDIQYLEGLQNKQ